MNKYAKLARAFEIHAKYADEINTVTVLIPDAEGYFFMWAPVSRIAYTPEEKTELEGLGWTWDEVNECWRLFT